MPKSQPKKAAKKPAPKAKAPKPARKAAAKRAPQPAAKVKPAAKAKPAPKVKPVAKAKVAKPVKAAKVNSHPIVNERPLTRPLPKKPVKLTPFLKQQRQRLMALRDSILDSMAGVAKDTLRSRPEGSEASAFGMHQADAGSDAYDKDFALSLLSQEQDALYEIEEAIKRVDAGTYGTCEMSGKAIPHPRLEALPFARFTVQCQSDLEKNRRFQRSRVPVTSLFGLTESEGESDGDAEETEETPAKPQEE
jgi:RNA polymerase-binding transcription factor DksA